MDDKEKIKLLEKQIELLEKIIELQKLINPIVYYPTIPSIPYQPIYPATPVWHCTHPCLIPPDRTGAWGGSMAGGSGGTCK